MDILHKNLLILASAGSGKTFQLGNRVIGLVARGIEPERIVALTFTRKAAGEFADSVLRKLAKAVVDPATARQLREDLEMPAADFSDALDRMVRALPRFTLGTMDSFFSKVVRGFQYELGLTGGKFELLEGLRAEAARDEILAEILSEPLEEGAADEFLHVFRRATIGKEDAGVARNLREFIAEWQGRYRSDPERIWGPPHLSGARLDDWETLKHELAAKIRRGLDSIDYTDKRQRPALEKCVDLLESHSIGSGILGKAGTLWDNIVACLASGETTLRVRSYKDFIIGGISGEGMREMALLAAHCEMAAAIERTRAIRDAVASFDQRCETRLRRRGLLGFDDVKILMGRWAADEDARLRREAVDFRLDARYHHWLLDEFQDTSGADWQGLSPLIDEAALGADHSMFIVGDRKQAIYAWRGGKVSLFDEVTERYSGADLKVETMAESWRSCPEVLELVNRICGDRGTIDLLFGEAAQRWQWEDHFPAPPLDRPEKRGQARVEVVGDWDERKLRIAEILEELGVGSRAMTCGVLVRSNSKVREVADELRAAGFDVIEEGRREPAQDNPVGIAMAHLLKWLANPADLYAWEVIGMSPLSDVLTARFGEEGWAAWEGLLAEAAEKGFAVMMENLVEVCWSGWSQFGRRRAGDLIAALSLFDAGGGASPAEAAEWIERLQVSQSPGIAAVQVMTIHKSKGLGFDVVILPEVPKEVIPQAQYFTAAAAADWICQPPVAWARKLLPPICEAEARWAADQQYEAMCMLYVALTRAKRGLYVLLEPPSKSADQDKASLANWIATSLESTGEPGEIFCNGSPHWPENVPPLDTKPQDTDDATLAAGIPRRERTTASGMKAGAPVNAGAVQGMRAGNAIHALLEKIGWIDEEPPRLPSGEAGKIVSALLRASGMQAIFRRDQRNVELLREQPIEAIMDGKWLSGVIDRLHLHRDADGLVTRIEVIDFKSDAVTSTAQLQERYASQMIAYRSALEHAYPGVMIECILVSTVLTESVIL